MSRENSSLSENILVLALSLHYLNITQLLQILHQPFSLLSWRRPRTSWSACVLYRSWRVGSKSPIVSLGEGCPEPDRLGRGVLAGKGRLGGRSALGEGCPRGSTMKSLGLCSEPVVISWALCFRVPLTCFTEGIRWCQNQHWSCVLLPGMVGRLKTDLAVKLTSCKFVQREWYSA